LADEALPLARGIDDPALLVLALRHAGLAAGAAGDGERERAATEEALAVAVQHGAVGELAETLVALGRLTLSEGDRDRTRRLLETALGYARQSGDRALMSGVLRQLGILACSQEDYPAARGNLEESLALARAIDFPAFIVFSLAHLAQLARRTGNHERASALARCALATAQRAGGSAILASAVRAYISVRVGQGGDSGVVRLAAAEAAWRASRPFLLASEQAQQEQDLAHLRATVAPATFEAEWTAGSSLTLEQSVAVTLADGG
jgi:tetratricopeptide (TPR) repeat protein